MHRRSTGIWDFWMLLVWGPVLAAGLAPNLAFTFLRDLANVTSRTALVNSPSAITLALSGFIGVWVLSRCREAGATEAQARGKALMAVFIGLTAFIELPGGRALPFQPRTFLEVWINAQTISDTYLQAVVLVVGLAKLFCWWFLFTTIVRYHALGNREVFLILPTLFPSASNPKPTPEPTPEPPQLPPAPEPPRSPK